MKFDVTYAGAVYGMVDGMEYALRPDGRFAAARAMTGQYRKVALTGYVAESASGNQGYQTTSGDFIILSDGWQYEGVMAINRYSQKQAQALVDKIIRCNKIIISNNLLCARYANKLTSEQQAQVRELQNRLVARNNALQAGGLTTNVRNGYPEGYAELAPALEKLMNGEAIGIATWVVIVVACVVVASLSTAAYYAYKYFASEAEQDVKFSKELTAVLAQKLTPEEYQQLLNETKGIVTKARIKQAISSTGITWASIALIAGGAFLMYKFLKR